MERLVRLFTGHSGEDEAVSQEQERKERVQLAVAMVDVFMERAEQVQRTVEEAKQARDAN